MISTILERLRLDLRLTLDEPFKGKGEHGAN